MSMNVFQFTRTVQQLLSSDVAGLTLEARRALILGQLDLLENDRGLRDYRIAFVPFVPGRRPQDEILAPGLGSSEHIGLLHSAIPDHLHLLFGLSRCGRQETRLPEGGRLFATLSLLAADGRVKRTLPGWSSREVPADHMGAAVGDAVHAEQAFVVRIDVDGTFSALKDLDAGPSGPFGFGSMFSERFRLDLALDVEGTILTHDEIEFEIFDERGFGSLYERIASILLPHDLNRQLEAEGRDRLDVAFHPWFPVLCIGVEKASLYMKAIRGDVTREKRMLTDPAWLLRVGLHLELLTCLGIIEVVREEIDLLSPEERTLFEQSDALAGVRQRIDRAAWSKVWNMRRISFLRTPGLDMPVGVQNLLKKKTATLAFLHAHHADLEHAIQLTGANRVNAQETWQRVFRDAERAVLKMNDDAFPELRYLPEAVRQFILWHRQGSAFGMPIPTLFSGDFGDQDGLFPSACSQYRISMNQVAAQAAQKGLMEYTGAECVPKSVSLLECYMSGNQARLRQLQQRDGYEVSLELRESDEEPRAFSTDEIERHIAHISIFSLLTREELHQLACRARTIILGPTERIIIQGNPGSSLFVLHEGELEVIAKTDTVERVLANLEAGSIVGEVAFLTGEPRTATVRAIDTATVIEIAARHLEPLVQARPSILEELSALMSRRKEVVETALPRSGLLARIKAAVFGS